MNRYTILLISTLSLLFFSHSSIAQINNIGNIPIQIGLSGLFAFGGSSEDNDALAGLQAGGHDPNRNGFTVQNVELTFSATVDPYFDAQANIIYLIDIDGETVVELEEAFFTSRSLPGGLQLKGGQYFTEFGRQNVQHPHAWSFVDQPVILSRVFGGDGLRSQGARISWLMPSSWYSELYFGMQNANGETTTSFLSVESEEVGGHVLGNREARNFSDLLYSVRWFNGLDISDNTSLNIGTSALIGPNSTGEDTETIIYGIDSYLKWQPNLTQRGFPFIAWHTELVSRHYEAEDITSPNREVLRDWGGFTQVLWGFKPGYVAGARYELADSNGADTTDPLRDKRKRLALNLTWYLSEYSKVRFQFNHDNAEHLADSTANSLWVQMEFNIGSHAAHKF